MSNNYFPIILKQKCNICSREFRFENCYRFFTYRTISSQAYGIADEVYIVCKNCANSKSQALQIIGERQKSEKE